MHGYLVIYEKSEDGWGAYVPDLPGLAVVGNTQNEVKALMREALPFHIEGLRRRHETVPEPMATSEYMVA